MMSVQMSFAKDLGSKSIKDLERYELDLKGFRKVLKDSIDEINEELRKVEDLIDDQYA